MFWGRAYGRSGDRSPVSGITTYCVCANTCSYRRCEPGDVRLTEVVVKPIPAGQSEYMYIALCNTPPGPIDWHIW